MAIRHYTTVIIGAGAAGLHCAAQAVRGGDTLVIDHARAAGEKIRISGGGRCNFTNLHTTPDNFLSGNPHFAKSALARYTQWDFIDLIQRHAIGYHEKTLGQLFCDETARDVITMLLQEMQPATLQLETSVTDIVKTESGFDLYLSDQKRISCTNLVIASGGKSIPKMGASGFGYGVAAQFDHPVVPTRAGLVPLTFGDGDLDWIKPLAGVSIAARVSCGTTSFQEGLLLTHRGLSGPSILQISSYWRETQPISVNLLPDQDGFDALRRARRQNGRRNVASVIGDLIPARLANSLAQIRGWDGNIGDQSDAALRDISDRLQAIVLTPIGTEGYRTAEVTLGGVSTDALNARTMESKTVDGLFFIGEVVDVTGWLGGYNFQWAWSSAWAAGTAIADRHRAK